MSSVHKSLLSDKDHKDAAELNEIVSDDAGSSSVDPSKSKRKAKSKKPKIQPYKKRDRSKSTFSIISLSEVTEGALQIWRTLPEKIRQDPSLASFRQENERIHGKYFTFFYLLLDL